MTVASGKGNRNRSGGRRIPLATWRQYAKCRAAGMSRRAACQEVGISETAALAFDRDSPSSSGRFVQQDLDSMLLAGVKRRDELCKEALRGLDDFGYFRARYFGRLSSPWQEDAAYRVVDLLRSPDKEYLVVNCPPGSGKSTLFAHDIPVWVAARQRSIRCLIGSRTERQARQYTGRIKRTLERTSRYRSKPEEIERGLAVDAEGVLAVDYGRFKPVGGDLWRIQEFIIAQDDDVEIEEKEPSFAAYGMDSGFLGHRASLIVWDDLVDKTTLRTVEARENQRKWWSDEAETRLEPGGLLVLQGQRMGAEDLYRYALDLKGGEELEEEAPRKYKHIIFPAHAEDRCQGDHGRDAEPFPQGCLLDPRRLPWKGGEGLAAIAANDNSRYRVVYQQEDVDPQHVLVPAIFFDGGRDPHSQIDYPGCRDEDRNLCELPPGLGGRLFSVASADPSPTKFWAVQWWIYHEDTQQLFLMDLERRVMTASQFLDRQGNVYSGLMNEWQERSIRLGLPITHWIVEHNAAQRFMLQYQHVKDWRSTYGVNVIAHQTSLNKLDPEYGVQSLRPWFEHGRVRCPMKGLGRIATLKLRDEVTKFPEGQTDDCVMAMWFCTWSLPAIVNSKPQGGALRKQKRPSWMRRSAA